MWNEVRIGYLSWKKKFRPSEVIFDLDAKIARLAEIEQETLKPNFWNDNEGAQKILKERTALRSAVDVWEKLKAEVEEAKGYFELAREEDGRGDPQGGLRPGRSGGERPPGCGIQAHAGRGGTTPTTPSSPSIPGRGERRPRTGRRYSCECTCAGRSARGLKPR